MKIGGKTTADVNLMKLANQIQFGKIDEKRIMLHQLSEIMAVQSNLESEERKQLQRKSRDMLPS